MRRSANQLMDEIALREASLADAQRELAAGELTPLQAATIEARETLALTRVREELRELDRPVPPIRARSRSARLNRSRNYSPKPRPTSPTATWSRHSAPTAKCWFSVRGTSPR